ncbi:thioredoxin reductase [Pseudoxanthomonas japonensis]|uniref:NAD(P)/FAD-dependent oxidoreductase n=1 Tax=Pseudoxanthomonas japonensis TaxID=69284 RepID=UPI00285576E3|nr:NAD(P)/FAD-dependent oxidoreductase [Pseudoxanthomonas japonensis]MDR7068072.1 thioredoxin reductase [Pseudoxanthomonas japonensis]
MKNYDVIVVGGSYAGMAAALQLVRARRSVLVIDAGKRRNRAASRSHGFLSQDGADPAVIASTARAQLEAYPTLSWVDDLVVKASGSRDAFTVEQAGGEVYGARRLLLATGVSDTLPNVNGLAERWGTSVFHCPYCHGYELDQGQIGVIAASSVSVHQAQLLPEWGSVTFLTNGVMKLDESTLQDLSARGVTVEATGIDRIEGHADVVLTDGRGLGFAGLFTAPKNAPSTSVAENLGCVLVETPMGTQIQTSETKETDIAGVFACGDVARVPHSVSLAVADGAWAGAQIHRSLVWRSS